MAYELRVTDVLRVGNRGQTPRKPLSELAMFTLEVHLHCLLRVVLETLSFVSDGGYQSARPPRNS